jgi:DNA-binding GntR family transcriptional regulator
MIHVKSVIVPVKEQIYETLKSAILSNGYKPGDILQIDRLAKEYGVSATPIRETLMRLEGTGLLKLIPNKGAQVSEIGIKDIKDIWEMRKLLEPYAGRLSACLIQDSEIDGILKQIRALLASGFDKDTYIQIDDELHQMLYKHLDNDYFYEAITRIQNHSLRIRYYAEITSEDRNSVMEAVSTEHVEILKALKQHDPDLVETMVRRHLENGEKRTLSTVQRLQG